MDYLIGFAFQIYCDFSGYSLMARGIAKYMGYHFKMNFNHPYLATSFKDFWNKWHISLSTWFRDYVYIPLGGSRKGVLQGLFVMLITMLVSGIWHGAGVTFLVWGGLHALYLALERLFKLSIIFKGKFSLIYSLLIFILVVFAWNFFRSSSMKQAIDINTELFSLRGNWVFYDKFYNSMFFLLLAIGIEFFINLKRKRIKFKMFLNKFNFDLVAIPLAVGSCLFLRGPESEFIYFQF